MNKQRELLIAAGTRFFKEQLRPQLELSEQDLLKQTLVCFSGSVAYGYADLLSDIEMEIYFRIPVSPSISQKVNQLLELHAEWESVRLSAGITSWKLDLVLDGKLEEFWSDFDPYQLFEMTHTLPIWDPIAILPQIASQIAFYPEPIFLKVVRGLWITVNDSGCYNAEFAIKRGNPTGGHVFLYRGLEALLRLAYVLNREYYPHSKWLCAGLSALKNDFGANHFLPLINSGELSDRYQALRLFIKEVETFLLGSPQIMTRDDVLNPWALLSQPRYIHSTF